MLRSEEALYILIAHPSSAPFGQPLNIKTLIGQLHLQKFSRSRLMLMSNQYTSAAFMAVIGSACVYVMMGQIETGFVSSGC